MNKYIKISKMGRKNHCFFLLSHHKFLFLRYFKKIRGISRLEFSFQPSGQISFKKKPKMPLYIGVRGF